MSAVEETELVARLGAQPLGQEALDALYERLGGHPQRYAAALEQAAIGCESPTVASHYVTEAARATLDPIGDVPEACRLLGRAVELDPKNARAAGLLARTVATELRRADYGGMLRSRALLLEGLAKEDAGLVWVACDAWELVGRTISASGGCTDDAVTAMANALGIVRRTFRGSGAPEAGSEMSLYSEAAPAGAGNGRDTIRTPNPASALVARRAPVPAVESDAEPTRPRAPAEPRQETLPPEDERPTETDLRVEAAAGATVPSPRPPSGPAASERPSASRGPDRLIRLSEAFAEVSARQSVEEAARHLADLVRRELAARAVLVHVYAPTSAEYVLMAASGAYDRSLLGSRVSAADPELGRAARAGKALVFDAGPRGTLTGDRWVSLEPKRCALVAPACLDGQPQGAIEVCDPLDRGRFDAHDEHALTYVAERWAELIAERGPY